MNTVKDGCKCNLFWAVEQKLEEHLKQISFKIIEALYETNTNMISVEVSSN